MKILKIDSEYYYYPETVASFDGMLQYLNEKYHTFVRLIRLNEENCVSPYFIESDVATVYVNVGKIESVVEIEATILSREEYDAGLKEAVSTKCPNCSHYEDDGADLRIDSHRSKLCLDGTCWMYSPKED